jgi:hypothetical protein
LEIHNLKKKQMSYPFSQTGKLTFEELMHQLQLASESLPDQRTGKCTYTLRDAVLGAFSVFFTQSPSFLDFQRTLEKAKGISNAQTLFNILNIPSDNHIRNLLDPIEASSFNPIYDYVLKRYEYSGYLEKYRYINGDLLIALDGTQYHSSSKICCKNCKVTEHKNGKITYSHTVITPVILAPNNPKVLPLEPEFLTPQDGDEKQDCENKGAKRWLSQQGERLKKLGVTILGDDLYCNHPVCEVILKEGLNFILTCKPDSHKTLYEWIDYLEKTKGLQEVKVHYRKGNSSYTDTYRFAKEVPLRDSKDSLKVSWCELTTVRDDGEVTFHNSFATNHDITDENVIKIVKAGRARWKIENENNNTLKTKGYNFTHNFGHGKEHLSTVMATLNILAFLFHTTLELMNVKYQAIRNYLPRKTFFDDIRALTRYLCFNSLDELLSFMMKGLELEAYDSG